MADKIKFMSENLYDNTVLDYTLTDYKEDTNTGIVYSPEMAQKIQRSSIISSKPSSSLVIRGAIINPGAEGCEGPEINGFAISRHNIPTTSSITLTLWNSTHFAIDGYNPANATNQIVISAVGQSNAWGDAQWGCFGWGGVISMDEISPMNNVFAVWFDVTEATNWEIKIENATPLSYNISRIFLGRTVDLDYNISHGHSITQKDSSTQVRTDGGSLRSSAKFRYKELKFKMATISPQDRDKLSTLFSRSGQQKDFLISIYPNNDNPTLEADYQIIGKFKRVPVMREVIGGYYSASFVIEET